MPNLSWKIGGVAITRVAESCNPLPPTALYPAATPEALAPHAEWLRPHFLDEQGNFVLSIHALVVESRGKRILVDTCVGEHVLPGLPGAGQSRLPAGAGAGRVPAQLDRRRALHAPALRPRGLEHDAGRWSLGAHVPGGALPVRARRVGALDKQPELGYARTLNDAVRPVIEAGLADLVETDHRVTDEVWLEPTPGHTPGHVSVRISSQGETRSSPAT